MKCLLDIDRSFDIPEIEKLLEFNIILSTCVSSGTVYYYLSYCLLILFLGYLYSLGVTPKHFTHILVDEAGEALEPETLIPIQLSNENTSIVLAGDHLQLGPIVR